MSENEIMKLKKRREGLKEDILNLRSEYNRLEEEIFTWKVKCIALDEIGDHILRRIRKMYFD